jgi:hypothetical protein
MIINKIQYIYIYIYIYLLLGQCDHDIAKDDFENIGNTYKFQRKIRCD